MKAIAVILINLTAGIACLITGVNLMSSNLEKLNLSRIRRALSRFTANVFTSLITGTVITAITQSSTAVTLITVSLVNSGVLNLYQAVGIIYGANIGTTVTAQFISFNIAGLAPYLLVCGLGIKFFTKKRSLKLVGMAITGFGLMVSGIKILGWSIPYIEKSSFIKDILTRFSSNPWLGLIAGTFATMLVQSSSATVGLTIVLFNGGLIDLNSAISLILGDNIGTCFTAQLASIRASLPAKQAALAHTLYNIIGSIIILLFLSRFSSLVIALTNILGQEKSRLVANAHTLFNIISAVVFLPFTRYYVKFIEWLTT